MSEKNSNPFKNEDVITEDNENLKKNAEQMEKEFIKEINMLNDEIDINKKKEADFMKEVKNLADEIVKIDKLIKGKQKE